MSEDVEQRVMEATRNQPPTPANPAAGQRLMYTGETEDEFYARRQPLEALWTSFMASNASRGSVFGGGS